MGLALGGACDRIPSLAHMPSMSLSDQDGDQNHGQGRAERRGLVDLSGSEHSR